MTDPQREALAALRFNWSETPDHIWSTSPYHVDGLHERIEREIRHGIDDAAWSQGPSPIGLVLQGQKGVGKTHLLGWVRREVLRQAMTHYARSGARSLAGFIDFLAELPDGVSNLAGATTIAADLAETLKAAMVNNPLLGGMGDPADPAALLTPAPASGRGSR